MNIYLKRTEKVFLNDQWALYHHLCCIVALHYIISHTILIWRYHRATCQQTQQSIKSYPVVLIALPLTPAACLLRAWLPVGGYVGVVRNNLNSIEQSCGEGCRSLPTTLYPLHPNSHKHPVSLCVMG